MTNVRLDRFNNDWYDPGRGVVIRSAWLLISALVFQSPLPWPYSIKRLLLRGFGAVLGNGVIIKPRVTIRSPWNLTLGHHVWIGEAVWIDSIGKVMIGDHVCLSQACMIETGNHDWSNEKFALLVGSVTIGDGAWACVRSTLLPGAFLAPYAVLCAGSLLKGSTESYGIYGGVPSVRCGTRVIETTEDAAGGGGAGRAP
jgi:putative colanic acid biosynthesis acetyltransferase WcaF